MLFQRGLALLLIVQAAVCYPFRKTRSSCDDISSCHNICVDPIHSDIRLSNSAGSNGDCTTHRLYLHLKSHTLAEIQYLQETAINFAQEQRICPNCIQGLQRQNLTNFITITRNNDIDSQDRVTNMYVKISKHIQLINQLYCLYARRITECDIAFPMVALQRLRYRILSKWFRLQEDCGAPLDQSCLIESVVESNQSMNCSSSVLCCEEPENIIYLLLNDSIKLLTESLGVLDSYI